MMRKVAAAASHSAVVETIVQTAYQLLVPQRVTVFLVDHARRKLIITRSEDVSGAEIPMDRGIAGSVASTGQIARVPDAYQDSRFNPRVDAESGFRTRAVLCVPIRNGRGQVAAVIQVINRREFGGMLGQVLVPGLSRAKLAQSDEDDDPDYVPPGAIAHNSQVSRAMGDSIVEVDEGDGDGEESEDGSEDDEIHAAIGSARSVKAGEDVLRVGNTPGTSKSSGGGTSRSKPFAPFSLSSNAG